MPLSVVSGLTRLGIDPWEEAARLATLPKAVAAEALAPIIAAFAIGRPRPSDFLTISQQLVELMPARGPRQLAGSRGKSREGQEVFSPDDVVAYLALAAAVLSGMFVM
jgi:hypothetical protein